MLLVLIRCASNEYHNICFCGEIFCGYPLLSAAKYIRIIRMVYANHKGLSHGKSMQYDYRLPEAKSLVLHHLWKA